MAKIELVMPKMGESITEATILSWAKNVGDKVEEDDTILEIATDKVDSEIPSPADGTIVQILKQVNDVVPVGEVIAIIETSSEDVEAQPTPSVVENPVKAVPFVPAATATTPVKTPEPQTAASNGSTTNSVSQKTGRFYSPLVKNIANKEQLAQGELDAIPGSGRGGRLTKKDLLNYLSTRTSGTVPTAATISSNGNASASPVAKATPSASAVTPSISKTPSTNSGGEHVEIIEMDRMRKLIADHMVMSKHTSPHVTSFVEADVTNLVNWRNRIKKDYIEKHGEKITFTPIFIEAVVKAIQDFPMVNVSVDGNTIIKKKNINIGMAAALPSGNLIVPVIKNANGFNLVGLTQQVNDFANRARTNKLKPDEIQGGTFTITNVGTFGNVMGTPIINQPQVAILAVGAIRKKPAVLETPDGDVIAVRQMMFLSLSYDHRVVDGFLGGSFLRKIADYLEGFDKNRTI